MNKKNIPTNVLAILLLATSTGALLSGTAPADVVKVTPPTTNAKPTSTTIVAPAKAAQPDEAKKLTTENSELKAQIKAQEKTIAKLSGENSTLKETIGAHEDLVKTIRQKNNMLEKQVAQLEAQLAQTKKVSVS